MAQLTRQPTADPSPSNDDRGSVRPPGGLAATFILAMFGGLSLGAGWLANQPFTRNLGAWAVEPLAHTARWAPIIGTWLLGATAILLAFWLTRQIRFLRRRRTIQMITGAAAQALRVPRALLRLRRAKWSKEQLASGRLSYRQAHLVVQDLSNELLRALATHVAGPVSVRWNRRRQRFEIRPRTLRLEEQHPAIQRVAAALAHIVGELQIDQSRTTVSPSGSVQRFAAKYRHTTKDIGEGFRLRIQTILDSKAPSSTGYWSVSWSPSANSIELTPAEPLPTVARYPLDQPELDQQLIIPLGLGEGAKVVSWLPEQLPHMLLVGPTGTGKTIFLFSLLVSCLARGWLVVLIDPKELSFRGFDPVVLRRRGLREWPGIQRLATSEQAMEGAIAWAHARMRDRYAGLKNFEVREQDLPPMLVIVDETGEMAERLNEYQQSQEKKDEAEAAGRKVAGSKNPELRKLWSNLRLGRQGRVFVVTATQRPDVTFIPGEARSNLTTRVGLGPLEGQALEMVFNTRAVQQRMTEMVTDPVTGEQSRQRIRGRATVDVGGGPQTIQTWWVPDPAKIITGELGAEDITAIEAMQDLVDQSRPRWRWQVEAPTPDEFDRRAAEQAFAVNLVKAEREEAGSPDDQVDDTEPAGERSIKGRDLEPGLRALLQIDGAQLEVEVEGVDEDPYDDSLLEITYRHGGLPAVTSIARDEELIIVP